MTLKEAQSITNYVHAHAQKCDGTVTVKSEDPISGVITKTKIPCDMCKHNTRRMGEIPVEFLSECLSEAPAPPASFSMATLLVESVFERGTHRTKRAQRDLIAGMGILRWYQDNGGKLNVSH